MDTQDVAREGQLSVNGVPLAVCCPQTKGHVRQSVKQQNPDSVGLSESNVRRNSVYV